MLTSTDSVIRPIAAVVLLALFNPLLLQASERPVKHPQSSEPVTDFAGKTYVKAQFGLVSESDFGPALAFQYESAFRTTNVFSLSIGKQVADHFFHWPARLVLYGGLQRYGERGTQSDVLGGTLYIKAYKQFHVSSRGIPIRFGLGEGLSYVDRIPSVEVEDFLPQHSARLVNYLEWSVQTSLGRWLGRAPDQFTKAISDVYIGYTIFHRSTVFGLFASKGGGVNYMGIGVELEFR